MEDVLRFLWLMPLLAMALGLLMVEVPIVTLVILAVGVIVCTAAFVAAVIMMATKPNSTTVSSIPAVKSPESSAVDALRQEVKHRNMLDGKY